MTDMLTAALDYAKRGTPIFPVDPNNKRPLCSHGFHDATVNETVICAWWMRWPSAMIGMPTGPRTRLWVLDVDLELVAAIRKSHVMMRLLGIHGALPNTPSATTPRGGTHFFFRWDGTNIRNSVGKLGPGIDVRGHGGYVVIPPSVRSDGRGYRWDSCGANEPTEAPLWLIEEILKTQSRQSSISISLQRLNRQAQHHPSATACGRARHWSRNAPLSLPRQSVSATLRSIARLLTSFKSSEAATSASRKCAHGYSTPPMPAAWSPTMVRLRCWQPSKAAHAPA
jgi:hypothetical protein